MRLDDYVPRTGYTGKLLAGNKSFYDLLSDKTLRELGLSPFDHDWSLGAVATDATHRDYRQGYVYDLYNRGLGAPPAPPLTSQLYQAGYWPTVFDTALLPATQPYGYSDTTRAAHELVAGYAPSA